MGRISEILQLAQDRARDLNLPYEGAVTPREAHEILQLAPGARLIDIRSRAELDWVGRIPGAIEIEWQSYPGNQFNPQFIVQLQHAVDHESLLLFICRSGGRSNAAAKAATEAGFTDCYNVLEGFEGDKDANSRRGHLGGWRLAGLPWMQS
ncbi:thiosulfate sulfurtransferase GlpE [mine drainage metagenome]|uniref:Thiosulfate sulfurtransferase GlpE n=1 Tax=mine drainage metagenome TaxID=410659 RepID=A0A1J5SEK4_9ZZZZ